MKVQMNAISRCLPLFLAILILWAAAFHPFSTLARGIAAIIALALLIQQWSLLHNHFSSRLRFYVLPSLSIPFLATVWFGLNQLRVYFYDPTPENAGYSFVCKAQLVTVWIATFLMLGLLLALIYEVVRFTVGKITKSRTAE